MQERIIKVLERAKEPLSRTEIADELDTRPETVSDRLRKLLKHKEICCIEINKTQALERYNQKKPMKLFYLKGHFRK